MGRSRLHTRRLVIAAAGAVLIGAGLAGWGSSFHPAGSGSALASSRAAGARRSASRPGVVAFPAAAAATHAASSGEAESPRAAGGRAPAPPAPSAPAGPRPSPLPAPPPLAPFPGAPAGGGTWMPAGRLVDGVPAVYETTLVPPGGTVPAGLAWMDTRLLSARLYSGSESPGGGPYRYTAPVGPVQAASLVAAFNGGFKMASAGGGYYTEGRLVYPLRAGAASLVIYRDGTVNIGAWGGDVSMTTGVVAVRQNLVPLVAGGQPTAAAGADWPAWGATCGAYSCSGPGIDHQWRSGVGVTADGALVYVTGPALDPLQLAQLLVRAGAVRGMELDINPYWTVFVTYRPATPSGQAAPADGQKLLQATRQGPATFFDPAWARDFITMSARPVAAG